MTIDADEHAATMMALVAFIEQYRPGFSGDIVPADDIAIETLEEYTGPLPGAYQRFLRTMGQSMGAAEIAHATFGIQGNIATYDIMPWLKRERYLLVAGDEGLSEWDYFMDRSRPHGEGDAMIVRMPLDEAFPPDANRPQFLGLEEFLYFGAFESLRMSQFKARLHFQVSTLAPRPPSSPAEGVCALAEQHGFRRVAPTPRCALYDRGDAALLLHQHPIEPTYSFRLHCDDPAELGRLHIAFEDLTGMRGR